MKNNSGKMSFNVGTASILHFWRNKQIQEETAFTNKADMHASLNGCSSSWHKYYFCQIDKTLQMGAT